MLALTHSGAFASLVLMLRVELKEIEPQVYLPNSKNADKEFNTGKCHGLKALEFRLNQSISVLQQNIKDKQNEQKTQAA